MATSALSISESARARKGWVGGSKSTGKQCAACCSRGMAKGLMPTIDIMGLLLSYCRRPGLASWGGANCSARALVWPARLKLALLASLGRRTTMSSGSVCGAAPMSVGLPSHQHLGLSVQHLLYCTSRSGLGFLNLCVGILSGLYLVVLGGFHPSVLSLHSLSLSLSLSRSLVRLSPLGSCLLSAGTRVGRYSISCSATIRAMP